MKKPKHPKIYSKAQLKRIRESGILVGKVLDYMKDQCVAGITTKELDVMGNEYLQSLGATSACFGYQGFPAYSCISIDEVVLHGIPDNTVIEEGMLVGIDCPVLYKGMFADAAINVEIGNINPQTKKLNEVTYQCLMTTLSLIKPGVRIGELCSHQHQFAQDNGYKVIKNFNGHGVGRNLHEPPRIPYFLNPNNPYNSYELREGNVLAIEPTLVTNDKLIKLGDGWGFRTVDKSVGTSWEHTVIVTKGGYDIITLPS